MLKLRKLLSHKSGDRLDFKFSDFRALGVPEGWDKLYVYIVLVNKGKTIAKSRKTSVRNGNCRWVEVFSKSIRIPREITDCLIKLIVEDSSRSSTLGEAYVNLTRYISSKSPVPVSLLLLKCNNGTVLQLKIQCLTPKKKLRGRQWNDLNSDMEDMDVDCEDVESTDSISSVQRSNSMFHLLLESCKNILFKFIRLFELIQLFKRGVSPPLSAAREAQSGSDEICCEGSPSTERAQMNKAVIMVDIYFEPARQEVLAIVSSFLGVSSIRKEIKDEKLFLTVIGDFNVVSMVTEMSLLWVTELVSFGPA